MYLLVTGRANIDRRTQVGMAVFIFGFLFAFGLLARDEVVLCELWTVAIAELTCFFAWVHRENSIGDCAVCEPISVLSLF